MYDSEELLERIVEWFRTGSSRPFRLEIRPTNRCNLRCPSCVARGNPHEHAKSEELSEEDYLRIIDEAAELGVRYVKISGGGEPFMYGPGLLGMMRRIKHHRMVGWVITNGTLLDEGLIEALVRMKWDYLFLSLDAPDPKLNDFLRSRGGCFDKIVSSIRQLNTLKQKYSHTLPLVHIGSVLSHYNCRKIKDMITLCAGLEVQSLVFQPAHVRKGKRGEPFLLTDSDLSALAEEIPQARGLAEKLRVPNNLDEIGRELFGRSKESHPAIRTNCSSFEGRPWLSIPCFSPWYYLGISTEGAVGPCSLLDDSTYKGDIRSSTLEEFWTGSHLGAIRESLMRKELLQSCRKCTGMQVIVMKKLRERLQKEILAGNQNGN